MGIASLLQIHYHFRTGGVREVILGYSEVFSGIFGPHCSNALICSHPGQKQTGALDIYDVAECDYQKCQGPDLFFRLRNILIEKIKTILDTMPLPAVVVCHNMSLAKNPALSAALRFLAKKNDPEKMRFFWVIHDFAEEGRVELLDAIQRLSQAGVAVNDELYAADAPVHYVVPGRYAYSLLKRIGLPVTCLPNPLKRFDDISETADRSVVVNSLAELASADGCNFDPQRPVYYYPSRLIQRKNVLEAVALVSIALDSNLVLGAPGTSTADKMQYAMLLDFVKSAGLKVVLNPARIPWGLLLKEYRQGDNPAPYLYATCDMVISTSLAEGFGYALYEPWLYGKALFARRPAGFLYPEAMDESLLYDFFPVYLEWTGYSDLTGMAKERWLSGRLDILSKLKVTDFLKDGIIDFGILGFKSQLEMLEKVMSDQLLRHQLIQLLQKAVPGWPGLGIINHCNRNIIQTNSDEIAKTFSEQSFRKSFEVCFSQIPSSVSSRIDYSTIGEEFLKCGIKLFFSVSSGYNENVSEIT